MSDWIRGRNYGPRTGGRFSFHRPRDSRQGVYEVRLRGDALDAWFGHVFRTRDGWTAALRNGLIVTDDSPCSRDTVAGVLHAAYRRAQETAR